MLSLKFGGKSKKLAGIYHQHHPLLECMDGNDDYDDNEDEHQDQGDSVLACQGGNSEHPSSGYGQ